MTSCSKTGRTGARGFDAVDNVIAGWALGRERGKVAFELRPARYDVAFNLHGGTTSTFLTRFLGSEASLSETPRTSIIPQTPVELAGRFGSEKLHSAEQHWPLIGYAACGRDLSKTHFQLREEL